MSSQPSQFIIKIANPSLEDEARAYLSSDVSAGATSLPTLDNSGFVLSGATYYYVLIGNYGEEKSEIVLVDADSSDETSFFVNTTKYSHSASDPITYLRYNQLRIYGDITSGFSPSIDNPIETIDIDPSQQFTEYTYEGSYTYFKTAFYNSHLDTISGYSDELSNDSVDRNSIKRIIKAGARKALVQIEQNSDADLNWDVAIEIVQDGSDEILARKRKWEFLRTIKDDTQTVANQQYIEFPDDYSLLEFVYVNGSQLKPMSRLEYNKYTATGGTVATGIPTHFTLKNDKIYLTPTPDSTYDIVYEYYGVPATISSDLSKTVKRPFVPILIYYCAAHFAYIKGNDKRGDKMYRQFEKLLEDQVAEYSGVEQTGEAEEIERTNQFNDIGNQVLL